MAKLRYKSHPNSICYSSRFNIHALAEVDMGDDSAFIRDLDVEIDGEWKDLREAFRDKDLITDNYNTIFFPPPTEADKERGFTL